MKSLFEPGQPTPVAPQRRRAFGIFGWFGFSLILAALLFFILASVKVHYLAVTRWTLVNGTVVSRSVLRHWSTGNARTPSTLSYQVRDVYRVQRDGSESLCHWDDPLGAGVRSWIDARVATRRQYWPIGAKLQVYAEPDGDRCEPLQGWERSGRDETLALGSVTLVFLGGAIWACRRRNPDPRAQAPLPPT